MLESIISSAISDIAETYLENFDSSMLNISLTSGTYEVKDLSLKPDILKDLHPAFIILRSFIGKVFIKLSLMKLRTEPVSVTIEDVFVLIGAKDDIVVNKEEYAKSIENAFRAKLQSLLNMQLLFEEKMK